MSITVGTVLKVVATLAWLDGDLMQNVFSLVVGGTGGPFDDQDIVDDATEWVDDMFETLVDVMSDDVDGSDVKVYEYDPIDDDFDEVGSSSWVFNPTDIVSFLPKGVATLINARSTDPDVLAKKYIGGWGEDMPADGLVTAAFILLLADFADIWVTPFVGTLSVASLIPSVWSVKNTSAFALNGDYTIPTIPAYQRRRKQGVGI